MSSTSSTSVSRPANASFDPSTRSVDSVIVPDHSKANNASLFTSGTTAPVEKKGRRYSTALRGPLEIKSQLKPEPQVLFAHGMNESPRISGLETWSGRVVDVNSEFFSAELVPVASGPTVLADFERSLLPPSESMEKGDVVYVTSRTVLGRGGYPTRTSSVRLRRLGNWTEDEVRAQLERADSRELRLKGLID